MRRKVFALGLVVAVALGVAGFAYAGGRGGGPGAPGMGWSRPGPRGFDRVIEEIGLTDDQLAQLRSIEQEEYSSARELRIKLMDLMFELRQLKLQRNPDEDAVEAKLKEIEGIQSQLRTIADEAREKMQSILTEDQKAKLESMRRPGRGFGGPRPTPGGGKQGPETNKA